MLQELNKYDLKNLSAIEIGRLVNSRKITPTEVLDYFKNRIEKVNPKLNAFVSLNFEDAYLRAKTLEKRLENGEYLGVFAGVPFGVKDFLSSKKGWTHSYGGVKSLIEEGKYDSSFTEAMEKEGGIAIGKTNSPAFGFRGTTDNKLYGVTRNPFNLEYNTGGSSGGSAAAVASKMVPICEGGDAGGSIRIPANWCNLVGFKAGLGSIPNVCRPDAFEATHPFCVNGGLTRTVEDSEVLFDIMNKKDVNDPYSYLSRNLHSKFDSRNINNCRIAVTPDFNIFTVDKTIYDKFMDYISILKNHFKQVDIVTFNINYSCDEIAEEWCKMLLIDSVNLFDLKKKQGVKINKNELPKEFMYWLNKTRQMKIKEISKFNKIKTNIYDEFMKVFNEYDFIISPTTSCLPILNSKNVKGPKCINNNKCERLIGWSQTYLVNFVGNPSISIPIGILKEQQVPIGMQVITNYFRDKDLFTFAYYLEEISPWNKYYDLIKED